MSEKTLNNIRIVHKHDTEENWLKATNFIPKQGELIIYDVDDKHNYERFKIGDGINLVNDLPFGSDWKSLENKPFGSKIVETECLTEITVDFDYDDDESIYYKYFDQNVMSYPLQAGKSYNVIIDGIVYEKLVCYGEEDSFNVKLGGQHDTDFSNYPFSISYNTDSQKLGIYLSKKISESTSTHTIEIIEKDEIINQIDGKYIPQSDLSQNDETAGDYVKGRTHWQDDNYTVWNGCYFSDTDVKENPGWHYIEIEENQKYKVTINNKDKYEGTVLRPYDGYGMHIGNAYLLDYSQNGVYDSDLFPDDTGEPFVIYVDYQSYDEVEGAWQSRLYFYFEDGYTVYDDGLSLYLERTVEGDIHQLDEKFIPDTIARKNDIPKVLEQFQSDMNEMDKYSPAFIKNKTHWYENSPYDYLLMDDDGEVYIQFTSEANVWVKLPDNGYFDIDGELLTVIFDGIKYRLSVVEEWGDEDPYYVLYHDKFEIKYDFYDSNMYIKTVESGEHNINIYRGGEHWNPLDEKYIPDTIARKSDLENIDLSTKADINHTHSFNDLEDKPFYEKTTTTEIVYLDTEHDFTTGGLQVDLSEIGQDNSVDITIDGSTYTATVGYIGNPIYEYRLQNFTDECPLKWEIGTGLIDSSGELNNVSIKISSSKSITEIKQIDKKYLPDMVGQKTEQGGEIFNYYPDTYNTGNAAGNYAHAEGNYTKANGAYSHAEGNNTIASGESSHAEGYGTTSLGNRSHAEGNYTKANGAYSHAEGDNTEASGESSHAEGNMTIASENYAHAEGSKTIASGYSSHAEGSGTKASATGAHAEGSDTIASGFDSHVQGRSNIDDVDADGNALNTYAHIVGNGSTNIRSNAHTLDWSGNAWYSGDVYVGSTSGVNKDKGSKKLATEEYVDTSIANLVDSAPEELNTLNELAVAMKENSDVVDALNSAITNKADEDHNHNNIYYTQEQVDAMELITIADIDEICGGITEGSLLESDVDELMARLQQ